MNKTLSIWVKGRRVDIPLNKQEPIAETEPVISEGAIVTLNGHKGKVLSVVGDKATVSWEDASISEVPVKGLGYDGRVEKGYNPDQERDENGRFASGSGSGATVDPKLKADKDLGGAKPVIHTVQGDKSHYKTISAKDWDAGDNRYALAVGYWVTHSGKEHHVYK